MNDGPSSGEGQRLASHPGEVRLLHRVSTELNAAQDVARILEVTLDTMDELFGFSHCSVFSYDSDARVLSKVVARGEPTRRLSERVRLGHTMLGAAAAKREIVRLNRHLSPLERDGAPDIAGHLAVPMLAMHELAGVIYIERFGRAPLRVSDEAMVAIVANQSAIALQNARLYRDLEARVRARTSELSDANRQLRETQAELLQSSKMAAVGQLSAGLAHEMNSPLGAIRSNADVIARAVLLLEASPAVKRLATHEAPKLGRALLALTQSSGVLGRASQRLSGIVDALRSFSGLDEAEMKRVDLRVGLESALALSSHRIGTRIRVTRELGELPPVLCQPSELNQVFSIVLNNAIDAIEGSGEISLTAHATEDTVQIEVADTGRGMSRDQLSRAFEPGFFAKGERVKAGLSLGVAFRILERHGGSIRLRSELGRGTTACLSIPVSGLAGPR